MKKIMITKKDANQRIDKFIKKYLSLAPLDFIYKLFRKKDIKVNNKAVRNNYILKENDVITIYIKEEVLNELNKPNKITKDTIDFTKVYEDENILIVNKPVGLLTHKDSKKEQKTLNNQILNYLYNKKEYKNDSVFTPSPVHRLDRNTSGIVIVAKNVISSQILSNAFKKKNAIEKEYIAITKGITPEKGRLSFKLMKDFKSNLMKVDEIKGEEAITIFETLKTNLNYSLVKIWLITGKTHQIRVHFAHVNNPILNDRKYGDVMTNSQIKKKYNYSYQLLHAHKITFNEIEEELSYLKNKTFVAHLNEGFKKIVKEEFKIEL